MEENVTVREVMNREFVGVNESDDLLETTELLVREEEGTAAVLRGNDPVGMLTQQDILATFVTEPDPSSATVGEAMTESVPVISPDAELPEARDKMTSRSVDWLLVTDGAEPLGTLSEHDILAGARLESETTERVANEQSVETAARAVAADGETTATQDTFEEQGICSACGTFTRTLASFNGQLLCTDCRDV